jgi:predicted permease
MTAFGGDPSIVGRRSLTVGAQPALIVGVLDPAVALPGDATDVWVHSVPEPASWATNRSGHGLTVLGLLRPGASEATVRAELATLQRTWAERYAGQHTFGDDGHAVMVGSIVDRILGTARRVAVLLSGAAGVLLLLACANVANLLLARGETRHAEVGVRIALGASRRRVAQPVVLEGLAIGVGGGLLGLALAAAGLPALMQLAPAELMSQAAVAIDVRVVMFAIVVSLLTGGLFALAPALRAARHEPSALFRAGGRGRSATMRGLRWLVAGQTALATLLLVGAGLFAKSLSRLNAVDPGLEPASRAAIDVVLPVARYRDAASVVAFYERLGQRVAAERRIERAAFVRNLPLRDGQRSENLLREGDTERRDAVSVDVQAASDGVLRTLGIPLVTGRDLEATDRGGTARVALVNAAAAAALWPGESAIGKRFRATFAPAEIGLITVVGVYGDVRSSGLSATPRPEIILPIAQGERWTGWLRNMTLVAQTPAAPATVLPALRAAVRDVDPNVAVEASTTMDEVVRSATARERFLAALLAVFAALALVIATVGVFGVVSFTVARQTRELAIRSALGAGRTDILASVMRTNAAMAAAGAVAGAVIAASGAPVLGNFLYNVPARDGVLLTSVPAAFIAIAVLACVGPAVRAMRVPAARALQDAE